ncbi:MAG TPA: FAD-dependent oxidoreductase [Steroidobacteraceae bacterium]|nr:FAD-dependent oxidoreductase [Steroidobacteraceae bacterium]
MDAKFAPLFEPLRLGPVTAPNRFYQVPHCTGMGHALPRTLAALREVKAEGGWGVVCTEYCSIHPSSDDHPYPFASAWDDGDLANLAAIAAGVHRHGALAGIELWHGGSYVANLATRVPSLGVRSMPGREDPIQSQRMDRADIRRLRRWHRDAALRARAAGFDIVYVYPTHGYLLSEFLSRSLNDRGDEYGGCLENRARLLRELLEETREAVGDRCAVAVRFSADGHGEEHLPQAEARELLAALGPLADLWDLVIGDYEEEMGSSRFVAEGALDDRVRAVRALVGRPVVSVGRFTSPDSMLRQIRTGALDLVGAARPSIADPFLPNKIRDDRCDEIRECIGCNVCYAHDARGAAIRCTQNPTIGEEWRSGWHPERVPRGSGSVLVVGAGPAGLEAAHILGKRGFNVTITDAERSPGGRVSRESRLPGLGAWARVRDYRVAQLARMPNVAAYYGGALDAAAVREFGADHVLIATGARWRRDGLGRWHSQPLSVAGAAAQVFTPDDIMDGRLPRGAVVVFDDDHYYMGPVLALALAATGARVRYVTTAGRAGEWSAHTAEQGRTQRALIEADVEIVVNAAVAGFDGAVVSLQCAVTGRARAVTANALVLVTSREPNDALHAELVGAEGEAEEARVIRIGDCRQPSIIAGAVYSGHKAARELGRDAVRGPARDRVVIGAAPAD